MEAQEKDERRKRTEKPMGEVLDAVLLAVPVSCALPRSLDRPRGKYIEIRLRRRPHCIRTEAAEGVEELRIVTTSLAAGEMALRLAVVVSLSGKGIVDLRTAQIQFRSSIVRSQTLRGGRSALTLTPAHPEEP